MMSDSTDASQDRLAEIVDKFATADQSLADLVGRAETLEAAAASYRDAEQAMTANTSRSVAALGETEERFSRHADIAETLASEATETASALRGVLEQLEAVLTQLAGLNPDRLHEDLSTLNTQVVTMDTRVSRLETVGDKITESVNKLQNEVVKRISVAQLIGLLAVVAAVIAAVRAG
jgi:chromosome segregation ATPase